MPDVFTDKPANSVEEILGEDRPLVTILNEKAHRPGLFTAFSPKPIGLTFETQEPNEEVLLLVRKHFITNLRWTVTAVVLLLLSFFLFPFLRSDTFRVYFSFPTQRCSSWLSCTI